MANIGNLIQNIRNAAKGLLIRSTIADGIEAINNEVESTTQRQTNLENTFNQEISNSTSNNPSSVETVAARTDNVNNKTYDNLPLRLDDIASSINNIPNRPYITEKAKQVDLDATNIRVTNVENNKRDKAVKLTNADLDTSTDANKVKLINLSDEVKQAMAGTTPINASVADGGIGTTKIADGATTSPKRTLLGEWGYIVTSSPITLDRANSKIHFSAGFTYIFYRDKFIDLGASAFDFVYSASGLLFYDLNTSSFKTGVLTALNENCIILGYIYPNTQFINTSYKISNGYDTKNAILAGAIGKIDINFNTNQITIPAGAKYVFTGKNFYTLSSDAIVVSKTINGLFVYDTIANSLRMDSSTNITENDVIIGIIYPNNIVVNADYTVNGKANIATGTITQSMLDFTPTVVSKYNGKKGVTFGDSISWYDGQTYSGSHIQSGTTCVGYQSYMRNKLGCTIDNQGISGNTMPNTLSVIQGYSSYADKDFVTLTSGANDHRTGVAVGTIQPIGSAFDTSTYAGAMQKAIEYILSQKPSIQIYLLAPIKGWFHEYNTTNVPNTDPTAVGVLKEAYPNMMLDIAKLYSLPILDWYHLSGINDITKDSVPLIGDNNTVITAYDLHPTLEGYRRMAESLIPFINNN